MHKTAGLAVHTALRQLVQEGDVSPHFHPGHTSLEPKRLSSWRILCGHFGAKRRDAILDIEQRICCTLIREPLERIRSMYHYWRTTKGTYFNFRDFNLPHVVKARELSLSEFIRDDLIRHTCILDSQSRFLAGDFSSARPEVAAKETLRRFCVVGVTDDVPTFLAALMTEIGEDPRIPVGLALARVNTSSRTQEFTSEDREYLLSLNSYDAALYQEALRRSQKVRAGFEWKSASGTPLGSSQWPTPPETSLS